MGMEVLCLMLQIGGFRLQTSYFGQTLSFVGGLEGLFLTNTRPRKPNTLTHLNQGDERN